MNRVRLPGIDDFRTDAYAIAIEKILRSYLDIGLF